MTTLVRLFLIVALIFVYKGPLQTYKSQHPQAWSEAIQTLKTIPQVMGSFLGREASLLPKTPPNSGLGGALDAQPSGTPNGTSNSSTNESSVASLLKLPALLSQLIKGQDSSFSNDSKSPQANASNETPSPAGVQPNVSNHAAQDSGATDNSGLNILSQFVAGIPSDKNPLNQVKVTGFSQSEANALVNHCVQLNLLKVIPELRTLSQQVVALEGQSRPLTATKKQDMVNVFNQSMALLQLTTQFYLSDHTGSAPVATSIQTLLNDPHLSKERVTIHVLDQRQKTLAVFSVQEKNTVPVVTLPQTTSNPL